MFAVVRRARLAQFGIGMVACLPFIVGGSLMVDLIYDDRYLSSGWILQTLTCGFATALVNRTYDGLLHAQGKSFESTVLQAIQVSLKYGAMLLGAYHFGFVGLVVGLSFSSFLSYPATEWIMRRANVWDPKLDLPLLGAFALMAYAFLSLVQLPT
jgi:O-antigen/teichoic acid export membrane protein